MRIEHEPRSRIKLGCLVMTDGVPPKPDPVPEPVMIRIVEKLNAHYSELVGESTHVIKPGQPCAAGVAFKVEQVPKIEEELQCPD